MGMDFCTRFNALLRELWQGRRPDQRTIIFGQADQIAGIANRKNSGASDEDMPLAALLSRPNPQASVQIDRRHTAHGTGQIDR